MWKLSGRERPFWRAPPSSGLRNGDKAGTGPFDGALPAFTILRHGAYVRLMRNSSDQNPFSRNIG